MCAPSKWPYFSCGKYKVKNYLIRGGGGGGGVFYPPKNFKNEKRKEKDITQFIGILYYCDIIREDDFCNFFSSIYSFNK
jgi:hypothetical protein